MPLDSIIDEQDGVRLRWSLETAAARTWAALVDPGSASSWLGEPVETDPRVGGVVQIDHGDGYICRSVIRLCEAPRRLEATWEFPDEPPSRIEIVVEPVRSDASTIELWHIGLGALAGSYLPGWLTHLTYFESVVSGVPLPPAAFWSLHGSFARLTGVGEPPATPSTTG